MSQQYIQIECASTVWCPPTKKNIIKVECSAQVRWLGHVRLATYKQCYSDVGISLAWPSLDTRRTHARIVVLHKIICSLVDIDANLYLELAVMKGKDAIHFIIPYARTTVYKYSFFPSVVRLWYNSNHIPSTQ